MAWIVAAIHSQPPWHPRRLPQARIESATNIDLQDQQPPLMILRCTDRLIILFISGDEGQPQYWEQFVLFDPESIFSNSVECAVRSECPLCREVDENIATVDSLLRTTLLRRQLGLGQLSYSTQTRSASFSNGLFKEECSSLLEQWILSGICVVCTSAVRQSSWREPSLQCEARYEGEDWELDTWGTKRAQSWGSRLLDKTPDTSSSSLIEIDCKLETLKS